jgi:uncharacterized protein (DUF2132 family)
LINNQENPFVPFVAFCSNSNSLLASMPPKDPLHGLTLETILNALVARLGWEEMGREISIRCFTHDPSVKSSLQFLRKTPWARKKVEALYLRTIRLEPIRGLPDSL